MTDLEPRVATIEENVEELATAVLGPTRSRLMGGGREEEEGLVFMVQSLYKAHNNGGVNAKFPASAKASILVALITSVSAVVVALVG